MWPMIPDTIAALNASAKRLRPLGCGPVSTILGHWYGYTTQLVFRLADHGNCVTDALLRRRGSCIALASRSIDATGSDSQRLTPLESGVAQRITPHEYPA